MNFSEYNKLITEALGTKPVPFKRKKRLEYVFDIGELSYGVVFDPDNLFDVIDVTMLPRNISKKISDSIGGAGKPLKIKPFTVVFGLRKDKKVEVLTTTGFSELDAPLRTDTTGTGNVGAVFNTVTEIIKDFTMKEKADILFFESIKRKKITPSGLHLLLDSRSKLYTRLIKREIPKMKGWNLASRDKFDQTAFLIYHDRLNKI